MSSDSSQGSISGKLTYSSENEISFPEGAIVEDINYMKLASTNNAGTTIWNIISNIVNSILAASLVYLLYRFFLESSLEKASSCLSHKFGKVLLTGLVSLIAIPYCTNRLYCRNIAINVVHIYDRNFTLHICFNFS